MKRERRLIVPQSPQKHTNKRQRMVASRASDDIGMVMDDTDQSDLESLFGAFHEATPTTPTSPKSCAEPALQEVPSPICSIDTTHRTSVMLTPPAQTAIQEDPIIKQALDKILAEQKRTNQLLEAVVRNIESFQISHAANIDSLRAECKEMALETTNLAKSLLDDQQQLLARLRKKHRSEGK